MAAQILAVVVVLLITTIAALALLPPPLDNLNIGEVLRSQRRHFDKEDLLEIVNRGLSPNNGTESKHVVIVGAGIAGLTAGYTLKKAGYDVTIIEASDRAGGRIRTHYADNWYAELGAMRIPAKHEFVNAWARKHGVSYRTFVNDSPNAWYYVNDVKIRKKDADAHPELMRYRTNQREEGKNAVQLFKDALSTLINNPDECAEHLDCLKEYDSSCVKGFLYEKGQLSHGALSMLGTILNVDCLMYTSLAETMSVHHEMDHNQTFYEIVGGMEVLPRKIVVHLEDDIIYDARVNKVTQDNQSVTVYYDGVTKGAITGSYVIITTTMQSMSFITFDPQLGLQKRDAIRNIQYINLLKIVLVFKSPFWLEDGITGGKSITDLPIRFIYYPSYLSAEGPYPLVVSYAAGDDANKFSGLNDEDILTIALDNLVTIHGPSVYDLYINGSGIVKEWQTDPYSLGGILVSMPYQIQEYGNSFDTPDGRIYFCGETEFPHGWIDTSIRTAMKTVAEINEECTRNVTAI